jgi:hypothetical protein
MSDHISIASLDMFQESIRFCFESHVSEHGPVYGSVRVVVKNGLVAVLVQCRAEDRELFKSAFKDCFLLSLVVKKELHFV